MLLENRVLWGGVAAVTGSGNSLARMLSDAADIENTGPLPLRGTRGVNAMKGLLTTSVQYTHAIDLLKACSVGPSLFAYEFLAALLRTPQHEYYCFFAPFRGMLGGLLRRIDASLRGREHVWHRLEILSTVQEFRHRSHLRVSDAQSDILLCGIDLHIVASRGDQEIVFLGTNPAQSRVFAAITDVSDDFTLAPISATFCVGSERAGASAAPSYVTIDRSGVMNIAAGPSTEFLVHLRDLLAGFDGLGKLERSADRPVYRSRNGHKRAILASISA